MGTKATIVGLGLVAMGMCVPLTAAAQELHPCTPSAPGVRCPSPLPRTWGGLDFGMPKSMANAPFDASHGQAVSQPQLTHAGSHALLGVLHRRSTDTPSQPDCSISPHSGHSAEGWFAGALPPLPTAPPVQPALLGHATRPPLAAPVIPSCKGK